MGTKTGSIVHPRYKGIAEWRVEDTVELQQPIIWKDPVQGDVAYDPKIALLEARMVGKVLWFPYWMSTSNTQGKMKWEQRPPMLEEKVLLELIKKAIKRGFFTKSFLKELAREVQDALNT